MKALINVDGVLMVSSKYHQSTIKTPSGISSKHHQWMVFWWISSKYHQDGIWMVFWWCFDEIFFFVKIFIQWMVFWWCFDEILFVIKIFIHWMVFWWCFDEIFFFVKFSSSGWYFDGVLMMAKILMVFWWYVDGILMSITFIRVGLSRNNRNGKT